MNNFTNWMGIASLNLASLLASTQWGDILTYGISILGLALALLKTILEWQKARQERDSWK